MALYGLALLATTGSLVHALPYLPPVSTEILGGDHCSQDAFDENLVIHHALNSVQGGEGLFSTAISWLVHCMGDEEFIEGNSEAPYTIGQAKPTPTQLLARNELSNYIGSILLLSSFDYHPRHDSIRMPFDNGFRGADEQIERSEFLFSGLFCDAILPNSVPPPTYSTLHRRSEKPPEADPNAPQPTGPGKVDPVFVPPKIVTAPGDPAAPKNTVPPKPTTPKPAPTVVTLPCDGIYGCPEEYTMRIGFGNYCICQLMPPRTRE